MNKTTFLGLSLLIVALFIASVPELLEPTARGVERAAVTVGVLPDAEQVAKAKARKAGKVDKDDLADKRLAFKGYVVEKDGDLRDTLEAEERAANVSARLDAGASRTQLPGELDRTGRDLPPAASEDGVLLDITGCPVFRPDTDVAVLLADPLNVELYGTKVAESDDPAACEPLLQDRIAAANAAQVASPLGATTSRDRAAIRRGGTAAMIVGLGEIALLAEIMDDASIQEALDALAEAEGAAPAAGGDTKPAAAANAAATTG